MEEKTKMKGVITQLFTYGPSGQRIDSQIVFKPSCDWYMPALGDQLGYSQFDNLGQVIDEFGAEVAGQLLDGEIVKVERNVAADFYKLSSCPAQEQEFEKTTYNVQYPIKGATKEYLVLKRKPSEG